MQIFLDSANIEEIKKALDSGCIDGITTNPTLITKNGRDFERIIVEIAELSTKENYVVNAEVTNIATAEEIVKQGVQLGNLHSNVIVKIPMTPAGIKATKILTEKNIRTNVTLCFSASQAILAAKANATYISPFIGRLEDSGENGVRLIEQIKNIYSYYGFKTKVLAASIRSPEHVVQAALAGADIVTVPFNVFEKMFLHLLTDAGIARFNNDWEQFTLYKAQAQLKYSK